VKKIVSELDPDQPVGEALTMDQVLARSMGDYSSYTEVLGIFAGIAVLLAVTGIYGVMSYFVNERTREFGIRVALGAQSSDVLGMVLMTGLRLSLIGVGIGTVLAVGAMYAIAALLYEVKPWDPLTYAAVGGTLTTVALLACLLPARRATKVDPIGALRCE